MKTYLWLSSLLVLLLSATPALAAGGACPAGNTTIDPLGNPINVDSVGVTGALTGSIASCFYVSKSTGADTNTGLDEAHPWAHLPGMPSCTDTCASSVPAAGEGFILRGGETWVSSDLGVTGWVWSGTSSHPIYIGVDPAWFNASCGGSWCRPIFDAQSAVSDNMFQTVNQNWMILDNIEMKGMRNNQNGVLGSGGGNTRVTQLYFHGWSHTGNTNNVGFFSQMGAGSMIDHNVIDGADSSKNTMNGFFEDAGTIQYNYVAYVVSGMLGNADNFNNNIIENGVESVDGDHCNLMFIFHPATGTSEYVYNNIVRKLNCAGGVNFWSNGNAGCAGCTTWAYNNIIDATATSGNVFNIGGHPTDGETGTYNIYNNTIITPNGGACMGNGEASPRSTTNFSNTHCINGSSFCDGTGTTCNDMGGNVTQSLAVANGQGYTAAEAHEYSPIAGCTPGTCSTVQAGTDQSASCSGAVAALCTSTAYPSYNSTTHTMGVSSVSPAGNPRGSTWDTGAYQYCMGAGCAAADGGAGDSGAGAADAGDAGGVASDSGPSVGDATTPPGTSGDAAGGEAGTASRAPGSSGGCGCRVARGEGEPALWMSGLAAAALCARRRRRRRR